MNNIKIWTIEWNYIYSAELVYNYIQEGEPEIICVPECCGRRENLWLALPYLIRHIISK